MPATRTSRQEIRAFWRWPLAALRAEAKSAVKLNHPNIISIYDYGVIGSRGAYMVMELLDGVTWRRELERLKRVPPPIACDWADQLLEGVREAHSAGILHRDLKPENVFLAPTPKGGFRVKILDFGLAKATILSMSGDGERLTMADAAVGTFGYMPPEQLAGGKADESSDLYSIGIIMIEALTGLDIFEIPSHKESLPTTFRDLFGTKAAREDLDRLSEVLGRSVAIVPRTRYQKAADLHEDLITVLRRFPAMD
jgi:serine/threonine-protein kinase